HADGDMSLDPDSLLLRYAVFLVNPLSVLGRGEAAAIDGELGLDRGQRQGAHLNQPRQDRHNGVIVKHSQYGIKMRANADVSGLMRLFQLAVEAASAGQRVDLETRTENRITQRD